MPIPRWVRSFSKIVTHRLTGPFAPRLPWFGVLVHVGRRTQRTYRTPINAFRTPDGYVFALTYGTDTDWLRNVQASGECTLVTEGRAVKLRRPRLFHDERRRAMPWVVRPMLALIGVADFVEMERAAPGRS